VKQFQQGFRPSS